MSNTKDRIWLAIRCITYNHESYIRECLEGFVMQKTNFKFVAIVHDDASTDKTADIIREYEAKYPDIIKPIYETENQYSKHDGSIGRIMNAAVDATGAIYVAMCEGDDYWTDPFKLQKQVDYLNNHHECVYSCHRFIDRIGNTREMSIAPNPYFDEATDKDMTDFIFTRDEYFINEHWITQTLTCVFRRDAYKALNVNKYKYYRDTHIVYDILSNGKGVCHSFVGGVYRKHSGGIFNSLSMRKSKITYFFVYDEIQYNNPNDTAMKIVLSKHWDYVFPAIVADVCNIGLSKEVREEVAIYYKSLFRLKKYKRIIRNIKKMLLSYSRRSRQ